MRQVAKCECARWPNSLRPNNSWMKAYKKVNNIHSDERRTTQKTSSRETLEEENKRLRKELAIVKQEREILKKATAYFAKETL